MIPREFQVLEGSTLYPLQSAIGRAIEQALQDNVLYEFGRLNKAAAALHMVSDVCSGRSLTEEEERFARLLLMEIVEHHGKVTTMAMMPFVQFVRSCNRCAFTA